MEVVTVLVVVVIGLLAILAMLFIPPYFGPVSTEGYGVWVKEEGRCRAKGQYCSEGGYKEVINRCIPNPETNRGCITPGTRFTQTYETIVTQEDCPTQCYIQRWFPISTSECINGLRETTYRCELNDPTGMNRCTNYEYIEYGTGVFPVLEEYKLGDELKVKETCTQNNGSSVPPIPNQGVWVLVERNVPLDMYVEADKAPIYNNTWEYQPLSYCAAPDYLQEGKADLYVGCLADGYVYVPSDQTHPQAPTCLPYANVPDKSIACRLLPKYNTLEFNTIEQFLLDNFGLFIQNNNLGFVTPRNLPSPYMDNPFPLNETFTNYMNIYSVMSDVPMMVYPLVPSLSPGDNDKITFQSGAYFYIVPQSKTLGNNRYRIVCLLGDGFRGYLKTDKNNTLFWEQGSRGPGLPGRLFAEAQVFLVYFNKVIGEEMTYMAYIYTEKGDEVNALNFKDESKLVPINGASFKIKFYSRHDSDNRTEYQYNIHHTLNHI